MHDIHIEHHRPEHTFSAIHEKKGFGTILKELLIDMIPVVLGILIALSFGGLKESWKEKNEERYYLRRLKNDLQEDLNELKDDVRNYAARKYAAAYLADYEQNKNADLDTAIRYIYNLFGQTGPNVTNAAYVTLQSSGKFDIIQNKEITEHLVILYSDVVRSLTNITGSFNQFKQEFFNNVVYQRYDLARMKDPALLKQLLSDTSIKNALHMLWFDEVMGRYNKAIERHQAIIDEITRELNS